MFDYLVGYPMENRIPGCPSAPEHRTPHLLAAQRRFHQRRAKDLRDAQRGGQLLALPPVVPLRHGGIPPVIIHFV